MIELSHIDRHFQVGDQLVKALDDVSLHIGAGEYVSIMGPIGIRQVDAPEPDRPPRPAHGRALHPRRQGRHLPQRCRAGPRAQQPDRLRVPDVSPRPATDGRRKRRTAPGPGRRPRRGARGRASRVPSNPSAWPTAATTGRSSSPAVSASAWPSPGPRSPNRACSLPTNPRATSITAPAAMSSPSSRASWIAGITLIMVTHDPAMGQRRARRRLQHGGRAHRRRATRARASGPCPA
jgi:putative ABC transport system ATP-binding protein